MDSEKDRPSARSKWQLVVICAALIVLLISAALLTIFTSILPSVILHLIWSFAALLFLAVVTILLLKAFTILRTVADNSAKLETMSEMLEKTRAELLQIRQNTRLSETAEVIASSDADRESLRQAIADIEKLLESYQWNKAGAQIENLIKLHPDCEQAKAMSQKLLDKKQERKKVLLNAWDDAVKRQATDRSLEILKELDLYLTSNEALALQEAARSVFKNKLHSLGIQFSLAVSSTQWAKALETGRQIVRDFPNSRMSDEIRQRMDALKQKVQEHAG